MHAPGAVIVALAAALPAACSRTPLPEICPPVVEGGLVITELRGPQLIASTGKTGTDELGEWIELASRAGRDVSLFGLQLVMTDATDARPVELRVADSRLAVADGARVVFGRFAAPLPDYVQYGYAPTWQGSLYPSGYLRVESCDRLVDAIRWDALPTQGTLAWSGALPPDAAANDDATKASKSWCNDKTPGAVPDGGTLPQPSPGTPGRMNPPCP